MVIRNNDVHDTGPRVLVRANSDDEEAAESFVVEAVPAVPAVPAVLPAASVGNTRGDGARPGFVEFHRSSRSWGIVILIPHCGLLRRRIRAMIAVVVVVVVVVVPVARVEGYRPNDTTGTGNRILEVHR